MRPSLPWPAIEVWSQRLDEELPLEKQVIERDGYRCSVPGCSARAQLQAHHVWPRGRGGPDADWNMTGCCMLHHLYGIHEGHLSVQGRAPDQLLWALGTRKEEPPLALFMGDVRVVQERAGNRALVAAGYGFHAAPGCFTCSLHDE